MTSVDFRVVSKKKVDSDTNLTVLRNEALNRISVEFSSDTMKLKVQKSFQDNFHGHQEAEEFKKLVTKSGLKKYFGIKE